MKSFQVLTLLAISADLTFGQRSCNFDGVEIANGAIIPPDVVPSQCYNNERYTFTCAPNAPQQLSVDFCSFATSSWLLCLRDGEEDTFVDIDGNGQRCSCDTSSGSPVSTCTPEPSAEVCSFTLPDDSMIVLQPGDGYPEDTRCGSSADFPCICNPNIPGERKLDCPYCSVAGANSQLVCLKDGESRVFDSSRGKRLDCSCEVSEPFNIAVETCVEVPGGSDGGGGFPGGGSGDGECNIGGVVVPEGDALGSQFPGVCGDPEEFPSVCNPNVAITQREDPYCIIDDNPDGVTCLRDAESIEYENAEGKYVRCTCLYLNYVLGGSTSCAETERPQPTLAPTRRPTSASGPGARGLDDDDGGDSAPTTALSISAVITAVVSMFFV